MKFKISPIVAILISLLFFFLLMVVFVNWGGAFFPKVEKEYFLASGKRKSLRELSSELENDKIIFSGRVFRKIAVLLHADKKLQTGVYLFSNRMSLLSIIQKLRRGEVERISILVHEGDDLYDIAQALTDAGLVESKSAWIAKAHSPEYLTKIETLYGLKKLTSIEGFIFPETYRVKKKIGLDEFFTTGLSTFDQKIGDYFRKNKNAEKNENIYFFLKEASLIEKETATADERPLVASVLENRLKIHDRLRFDPTIIYALKVAGLYEANLRNGQIHIKNEHFTFKSPYNTYAVSGLPLTPIANPSLSSFVAAMRPAKSDFLFFVAKGPGSKEHAFSKTFNEHQKYVDKYQLGK